MTRTICWSGTATVVYGGELSEDARQGAGWGESARETARDLSEGARRSARECT